VNGDGKLDLVVVMGCDGSSCLGPGPISVLLGNGNGTFGLETSFSSGYFLTIADVNGDDRPDLLLADLLDETGNVLLGNGDGTFQGVVEYHTGGNYPYAIAVADINGDGKLDLVLANQCAIPCGTGGVTGVLFGNGDGTFQSPVSFGSGGVFAHSVALADLNGDGKPDLVVANCGSTSYYCQGEPATTIGTIGVLMNNGKPGTTTTLASSQNPSNFGQPVTFTATVTAPGGGTPTGTVSYFNGTREIGNSNLNGSDVATLTTSALPEGTLSITATYSGDANFGTSTSPVLDQVVEGATVTLSPTSLNFGLQTAGTSSAPQVVMLTNTGVMPLVLASIGISGTYSGDFAQTNNCPSSIPPNGGCNISVKFTPTAGGNRTAAVSISDNAPGSPQNLPLTGIVPDFSVTANSPTSQTVTGQAANFVVTVTPLNGFAETVPLSCSGTPAQSTCTVTPSSVTLNGSSAVSVNVAVVTAGASAALGHPSQLPTGIRWVLGLALSPVAGLVVLGGVGSIRRHRHCFRSLALLAILSVSLTWPACGGGGGSGSGGGTPVGTYNVTVTGTYTSGPTTLSHATRLTLVVR
jgi:Bacterial Ig-like domain (group 3)/FG-GAP-like repeat